MRIVSPVEAAAMAAHGVACGWPGPTSSVPPDAASGTRQQSAVAACRDVRIGIVGLRSAVPIMARAGRKTGAGVPTWDMPQSGPAGRSRAAVIRAALPLIERE